MIIDAHCHVLPPEFHGRRADLLAQDATFGALFAKPDSAMAGVTDLIQAMDRDGVSHSVIMGIGWATQDLARESNDYLIDSALAHVGRLSAFCSLNPAWGDAAVTELERCVKGGAVGIGELHADSQGFDITDRPLMAPVMDAARRLSLPVLVHASEPVGHQYAGKGETTPGKLYRFIQNFPDNVIICAHWGGGLPFYALMPEVPEVIKNAYFDTAVSPFLYRPQVVRTVVDLIGPDRILFGTDFPLIQPKRLLGYVEGAGLEQAAHDAILGGNAAKLLGL
ncbi:MAG TPA: amidohydrolase [Dehalococcoidia bacterium]|nr:amidohydrolase [Dehalococcoidia bacterium]